MIFNLLIFFYFTLLAIRVSTLTMSLVERISLISFLLAVNFAAIAIPIESEDKILPLGFIGATVLTVPLYGFINGAKVQAHKYRRFRAKVLFVTTLVGLFVAGVVVTFIPARDPAFWASSSIVVMTTVLSMAWVFALARAPRWFIQVVIRRVFQSHQFETDIQIRVYRNLMNIVLRELRALSTTPRSLELT